MIIFLDIDGVLVTGRANMPDTKQKGSSAWNPDTKAVEALNYLLSKLDNPSIVISSTWRLSGLEKMQEFLTEWGVTGKVISITPICGLHGLRSHEIHVWLEDNKYNGDYVVIDDENFDLLTIMPDKFLHVVNGWENGGLTKELVDNFLFFKNQEK